MSAATLTKKMYHAIQITNDFRWTAVVKRDAAADGKFYYVVKTTGVHCRLSCAARLARSENVCFYITCEETEKASFRPCKRCQSDQISLVAQYVSKVTQACRRLKNRKVLHAWKRLQGRLALALITSIVYLSGSLV